MVCHWFYFLNSWPHSGENRKGDEEELAVQLLLLLPPPQLPLPGLPRVPRQALWQVQFPKQSCFIDGGNKATKTFTNLSPEYRLPHPTCQWASSFGESTDMLNPACPKFLSACSLSPSLSAWVKSWGIKYLAGRSHPSQPCSKVCNSFSLPKELSTSSTPWHSKSPVGGPQPVSPLCFLLPYTPSTPN